jgi:hypothetical protein
VGGLSLPGKDNKINSTWVETFQTFPQRFVKVEEWVVSSKLKSGWARYLKGNELDNQIHDKHECMPSLSVLRPYSLAPINHSRFVKVEEWVGSKV